MKKHINNFYLEGLETPDLRHSLCFANILGSRCRKWLLEGSGFIISTLDMTT